MRGLLAAVTFTAAALLPAQAMAQAAYPTKAIKIIVPAAAGGPSDTVARLVADAMKNDLGQPVTIENAGGAGGSLGAARVADAAPDGYTLLLYHIGVATFTPLYPELGFKPAELTSVGVITEVPLTVVGRKDLAPTDIAGLLTWLKGDGKNATFGTAGIGAASDLCGRLISDATGIQFKVVPFPGTGPAMTQLMGRQIDVMCDQTTNTMSQITSGDIKAYAVTTRERIAALPNTPTLNESGLKAFDLSAWHAIWAPKGTPEPIRQRLSASLQKALKDPKVVERFAALGTVPVADAAATPAALDKLFQAEIERWGKLLAGAAQK